MCGRRVAGLARGVEPDLVLPKDNLGERALCTVQAKRLVIDGDERGQARESFAIPVVGNGHQPLSVEYQQTRTHRHATLSCGFHPGIHQHHLVSVEIKILADVPPGRSGRLGRGRRVSYRTAPTSGAVQQGLLLGGQHRSADQSYGANAAGGYSGGGGAQCLRRRLDRRLCRALWHGTCRRHELHGQDQQQA